MPTRPLIGAAPLLLAALALGAGEARGQDAALVSKLVRTAWYWQARARSDKALEAWKQVLEAAPDDPQALAAVGGFDARGGRLEPARAALARLEKVSPGHPDVPVLRRQIELGPRFDAMLAQARKSVHGGRPDEAAGRYRQLFGSAGPPGDLALEYYQSIGGTPGGWEEARDGLRRVVRRASAEPRYRLALGELLTWRQGTRREGIGQLAALARDPAVGKEATASWRQALLWLGPVEADLPLLRAFLRAHPGDAEIARRVQRGLKAGSLREGFALLERGDLAAAEKLFRSLRDDDPETRRGLALVQARRAVAAQREGQLDRALELLTESRRLSPEHREVWGEALRSVNFWRSMEEAQAARKAGRPDDADRMLQAAIDSGPPLDRWHAELALADLRRSRGRPREAEDLYRDVLGASPDQPDALQALAGVLVEDGRFDEALPINERLARKAPDRAFSSAWLRAELLRGEASRLQSAGDAAGARQRLTAARRSDPTDVWVLHDLANALLETGGPDQAQPVVDELVRLAPALPQAQVVQARLLAARGDPARALSVLEALPGPPADQPTAAFRKRLEVQTRLPVLIESSGGPGREAAVRELASLQRSVEGDAALSAQIAVAWARLGEPERAMALMRSAVAKAPAATRGARLELASSLLAARADAAADQILTELGRDTSLSGPERRSLRDLRIALAIQVADEQRLRGQPRAAAATLEPLVNEAPGDARLQEALARVWEHEDPDRAHRLYARVLELRPDDAEALRGSIDTDLALGRTAQARALTAAALERHPQDPRWRVLAARISEREGDDDAALRDLRRADQLLDPPPEALVRAGTPGGARAGPGAAFVLPPAEESALRAQIRSQELRIEDRHIPAVLASIDGRLREGEGGLSRLGELRESVDVEVPLGLSTRASLHAAEVELDAGGLAAAASPRYGTGAQVSGHPRAVGTELMLSVGGRNFGAFVGSTPIGFPVLAVLGGAYARGASGPFSAGLEVSRRQVKDSLLSQSGATDPGSGRRWGGVVMDGARGDLGYVNGLLAAAAWGEAHRLIGLAVPDNLRGAGGASLQLRGDGGDWGEARIGPTATVLGYDKNLRFFTFGQGGYFSPQRFFHGGLLMSWVRRAGAVRWELIAEPGYDSFQEARSPAFPLDPSSNPQGLPDYAGRSQSGASFNGRAALRFQLADHFDLGLSFEGQRAPEFQELRGGIQLRFGARP